MVRRVTAIDGHVGGQALRLVIAGFPRPHGRTVLQQRDWLKRNADALRRAVVLPPRGHADLVAAMLTESGSRPAHAGLLLMDATGYPSMSGHAVIAATTIALERALIFSRDFSQTEAPLVVDTAARTVRARARLIAHGEAQRVDAVTMTDVSRFVCAASHAVKVGTRQIRVDVAFGGSFFAIVDAEATGIPLMPARLPELRRLGVDICSSLDLVPEHPADSKLAGISGVIFTGPPQDPEAHLRNVTVGSGGSICPPPDGTRTWCVAGA